MMDEPREPDLTTEAEDTRVVERDGRRFVLVGTAHISRESAELVRAVIVRERPDRVCIELDEARLQALSQPDRFESLDLKEIIRRQQLATLLVNLVLASYQKQLGGRLGVQPGAELMQASRTADELGIPVVLCDRDIRLTLKRAWGALSFWRKCQLGGALVESLFEDRELSEDELRELRSQDVVTKLMDEIGQAFPALKVALIDERDAYLAERIRRAEGDRVVAVVGAGHVEGIREALEARRTIDLALLETIPPSSSIWKWVGWGLPVTIIGAVLWIGLQRGTTALGESVLFWVLASGGPSMLGAALAFAHPLTILTAFVAAPFTTLSPLIGAGHVAAFAQAWLRPPRVHELRSVAADIRSPRAWWRNRLLQVFLVFLLCSLGASLGALFGGLEILKTAF
jgi:pheromone shutdown-related protein TraB